MENVIRVLGVIHRDASIAAFTAALDSFIVESETEESTLAEAVHAVFDSAPGKRMTAPTVVALAMTHIAFTPETYTALADKVKGYIQANSGPRFQADGFTPLARLSVRKGPGGGVCRWNDLPLSEKLSPE